MTVSKPKLAKGCQLKPIRIIGTTKQGNRIREVWDCKCKCGSIWAAMRDHLMSGRELMCGKCKKAKKQEKANATTT